MVVHKLVAMLSMANELKCTRTEPYGLVAVYWDEVTNNVISHVHMGDQRRLIDFRYTTLCADIVTYSTVAEVLWSGY